MPKYVVSFDNVAFSGSIPKANDPVELELSEAELGGFNDTKTAEGTFQKGVVGVAHCRANPDDSVYKNGRDETGDLKLFVSIGLIVEADNEDQAEQIEPDREMLATLTDMLADGLDLEETWDMLESEPYVEKAPSPAL